MGAKDIKLNGAARAKIVAGVDALANAVTVTFGPRGRHVILDRRRGFPIVTRGGLTVAREMELSCRFENAGAQLVREAASKTSECAGDGTTTAILLTRAIVKEAMVHVAAGCDPMGIKLGVDRAVEVVVHEIEGQSQRCQSRDDVARVATISANGDADVGDMIAAAIERVGSRGVISIEPGRGLSTELEVVEGLQFESGYISPSFVNDRKRQKCLLQDAHVLVCDKVIATGRELVPLLEAAAKSKKSLIIIAEDVTGDALSTLAVNAVRGTVRVCAVRAPDLNDRRADLLRDIAVVTGTHVVSPEFGMAIENVALGQLGRVRRVEVGPTRTVLAGAGGDADLINIRKRQIEQRIESRISDFDVMVLTDRLAKLQGGAAVIRVGGPTEVELDAKRGQIEDAVNAARAAMDEGIIPGGGVALLRAKRRLHGLKGHSDDEAAGISVVRQALEEPIRRLAANAGVDASMVVGKVSAADGSFGYDVAADQFGDLIKLGIVDPTKVTRNALQAAASTAGLILANEAIVVDAPKIISIHEHDAMVCGCGCGDRRSRPG